MGDINLDMTKSPRFLVIPYACAAIGAAVGVHLSAAASLGGLATAGVIGAVAGGIGIPMALTGVAVLGFVGFVGLRETFKALKKEGATVPLGMALIAANCAKALFVTPFQAAAKLFKGFGKKHDGGSQQSAPASSTPSKLGKAEGPGNNFNAKANGNDKKPDAKPVTPAPVPPPPKP